MAPLYEPNLTIFDDMPLADVIVDAGVILLVRVELAALTRMICFEAPLFSRARLSGSAYRRLAAHFSDAPSASWASQTFRRRISLPVLSRNHSYRFRLNLAIDIGGVGGEDRLNILAAFIANRK